MRLHVTESGFMSCLLYFSVYFEASDDCNTLTFQLGTTAVGLSGLADRRWNIKATQISCDDLNRAPA